MPISHVVAEGESTSSLAAEYGFSPHTIWNHPENDVLREKRVDMNILMPGDVIIIPDKKSKEVNGATKQVHRFVLRNTPALFRLQIYHADGRPRRAQDYQLTVDEQSYYGTTDQEGVLREYIPPQAKTGCLVLTPQSQTIDLRFGTLNPVAEDSGVRQRLTNLGFKSGATAEELQAALYAFQKDCGLRETGELDEETQQKLEALHDTVSDYPVENGSGADVQVSSDFSV